MVIARAVPVEIGDSLRRLALRHLGDANRWVEIAELNQLRPPYLIESVYPSDRIPATRIFGDSVLVPMGQSDKVSSTPLDIFGADLAISRKSLDVDESGDYAVMAGVPNLGQALRHRMATPVGDIVQHPTYGCNAFAMLGLSSTPLAAAMAAAMVRKALDAEPRLVAVQSISASIVGGDQVDIQASVMAADKNTLIDANFVYPLVI